MRGYAFGHHALQTQRCAHERDSQECNRFGPRWRAPRRRDAGLVAFPRRNGRTHDEKCLDQRAEEQPESRSGTYAVSDFTHEDADRKAGKGRERLFVHGAEGKVAIAWREYAPEAKRKLGKK